VVQQRLYSVCTSNQSLVGEGGRRAPGLQTGRLARSGGQRPPAPEL